MANEVEHLSHAFFPYFLRFKYFKNFCSTLCWFLPYSSSSQPRLCSRLRPDLWPPHPPGRHRAQTGLLMQQLLTCPVSPRCVLGLMVSSSSPAPVSPGVLGPLLSPAVPPSPLPTVSTSPFSMSVSPCLPCKQVHQYFSAFCMHVLMHISHAVSPLYILQCLVISFAHFLIGLTFGVCFFVLVFNFGDLRILYILDNNPLLDMCGYVVC